MAYTEYFPFSLERVFGISKSLLQSIKVEGGAKSRRQRILENALLDAVGLVWTPQVLQLIYPSLVAIDVNNYHYNNYHYAAFPKVLRQPLAVSAIPTFL